MANQQFARFVKTTGYLTEAEQIGWSYGFYQLADAPAKPFVIDTVVSRSGCPLRGNGRAAVRGGLDRAIYL